MEICIERAISIMSLLLSICVAVFGSWLIQVSQIRDTDENIKKIIQIIGHFRYHYILLAGEIIFFLLGIIFLLGGFYLVIITSQIMWALLL